MKPIQFRGKETMSYNKTEQSIAEGAEEIFNKYQADAPMKTRFINFNEAIKAMQEFAALHAQRIAEKTVSEKLRELMLGLLNSMSSNQFDNGDLVDIVDEYLKTRDNHE